MLGDCYAAAVVEELSRKELMALDAAAVNYQVSEEYPFSFLVPLMNMLLTQDLPVGTPNGHHGGLLEGQTELEASNKSIMSDAVVVDMSAVMNNVNLQQDHSNRRV